MRLVSSKTLLTLATALVAVPGAAIAAAEPGEPLLQVGAAEAEETDCEQLLDAPDDEDDAEGDVDDTTADADDTTGDEGAVETQAVPEECEDHDDEVVADDADDESVEDDVPEADPDADEEVDQDGEELESRDAVEADDTEEAEDTEDTEGVDDAHGEIVSTVAQCAPRGRERVDGFDLPNHGAYVSAAAKGEMLEVGDGYDLGTLEGATALCDDLDAARDAGGPGEEDTGDETDETAELETSEAEEPAPERDAPAGPATDQRRGGESGPPEQAGNAGGGKGKGPQNAPGRNR